MKLLERADEIFGKRQYDQAMDVYKQALNLAEKESNSSAQVEALSQIARCFIAKDKLEDGAAWLERARAKADTNDPSGWSRYLGVRGRLEWKREAAVKKELTPEARQSAATFKELYDYCLQHDLYERAIDAANMMSIVGSRAERIDWGLKGIQAAEKGSRERQLGPLWNNLGWNYDEMGEYDKALEALQKAREYHYRYGDDKSRLIADWSVGHAFRMTAELDSADSWISDVSDRAMTLYNMDPSPENAEWVGFCGKELGEIALANDDKKTALGHFQNARLHLEKAGMADWDLKGYQELVSKIESLKRELGQ